jgi:hypothetical protein
MAAADTRVLLRKVDGLEVRAGERRLIEPPVLCRVKC